MVSRVKKKKGERKDSEPQTDSSYEEVKTASPAIKSHRRPSARILYAGCLIIAILIVAVAAYFKDWHIQIRSFVSGSENDTYRQARPILDRGVDIKSKTKNIDKEIVDSNSNPTRDMSNSNKIRWASAVKVSEIEASLAGMEQRVANLEKRREKLDRIVLDTGSRLTDLKTPINGGNIDEHENLRSRISDIEADRLGDRSEILKLKSAIENEEIKNSELNKKIKSIEKIIVAKALDASTEPDRAALLIFSVSQISNAISRSDPFTIHLGALQAVAKGNERMLKLAEGLRQYAESGVPTVGYLKNQFFVLKKEISDRKMRVDDGLVGEALSRLGSLVKVRKLKEAGRDIEYDALMEAEKALNANDIRGAVDRLSSLDRIPSSDLDKWLREAMARIEVEKRIMDLRALALTELAKGG